MRRYSKISGMTLVSCDWKGSAGLSSCNEEFHSASMVSVVPDQLKIAKWERVRDHRVDPKAPKVHLDLCPIHAAAWREMFGPKMPATRDRHAG